MLWFTLACFVPPPEPNAVVYDAQGLPDCAESFSEAQMCEAIAAWRSTEVEGFTDGSTSNRPIRWIGTEVDPAWCSDDAAEAEAYVVQVSPDGDGAHRNKSTDTRWWDFWRYDAEGSVVSVDRVMRCSYMARQAETPPGTEDIPELFELVDPAGTDPETFFPLAREFARWRNTRVTVQGVVAYGEAESEARTLRVCSVRCGECGDLIGPTRNYTAVLESQDWVYSPETGVGGFSVESLAETECQARF